MTKRLISDSAGHLSMTSTRLSAVCRARFSVLENPRFRAGYDSAAEARSAVIQAKRASNRRMVGRYATAANGAERHRND